MKKSLYSLMLSEDVVRAVDAMAHRMGTNRSALVNQILADRMSVATPERRIQDVFRMIEELVSSQQELIPFVVPNSPTMSLKSSLSYKYRPTVKYEVELHRGDRDTLGELSIVFRTQSLQLIEAMGDFFRLWARIENTCLVPLLGRALPCSLYDGRFVRPIALPHRKDCTAEELAIAISAYVQLFDRLLKGYVSGNLSAHEVEQGYCRDLAERKILL